MTKPESPRWRFAEYEPVGVDLGTHANVERYDANQGTNAEAEDQLLDRLGIQAGTRLIDLACGTGSFAIRAAGRGADVHAIDVSSAMLEYAQSKASEADVDVAWHRSGFLDYVHHGALADVVTTKSALHQLPDMWKQEALLKAAAMLRPGGTFYLWDVIFSFDPRDAHHELERWIEAMGGTGFTTQDFETHVREEFSTYSWIIEGLLERAGLRVTGARTSGPTYAEYICQRAVDPAGP